MTSALFPLIASLNIFTPSADVCSDLPIVDLMKEIQVMHRLRPLHRLEDTRINPLQYGYPFINSSASYDLSLTDHLWNCSQIRMNLSFVVTLKVLPDLPDKQYLLSVKDQNKPSFEFNIRLLPSQRIAFNIRSDNKSNYMSVRFKQRSLFDANWHSLQIKVDPSHVYLSVDCSPFRKKRFHHKETLLHLTNHTKVIVGGRGASRNRFKGYIKDLLLVPRGDVYHELCPPHIVTSTTVPNIKYDILDRRLPEIWRGMTCRLDSSPEKPRCKRGSYLNEGRLWYSAISANVQLCQDGNWKLVAQSVQEFPKTKRSKRLDYFETYQEIHTSSPQVEVELFTIPGEAKFAFLGSLNSGDSLVNSTIFKWENKRFVPFQNISSHNCFAAKYFTIEAKHYLGVINYGTQPEQSWTKILEWDPARNCFQTIQKIPCSEPRSLAHMEVGSRHFLVVGNHKQGANYTVDSLVLRWDAVSREFVHDHNITTRGVSDLIAFSFQDDHYIGVANSFDGMSTRVDSWIYKWNGVVFHPYQALQTRNARDMDFMNVNGKSFLFVSESNDNIVAGEPETQTTIYKLNTVSNKFQVFQTLPMRNIVDLEVFSVGREKYLIASTTDFREDIGLDLTVSPIYRYRGAEKFVKTMAPYGWGASDWEAMEDGADLYLVSASTRYGINLVLKAVYR